MPMHIKPSVVFDRLLTDPQWSLGILGLISISALAAALVSQYAFGLYPCELCLYQRIPYAVVIMLAVAGIAATRKIGPKYGAVNLFLCGVALLINAGIAFYHVGVEQAWWASGCAVGNLSGLSASEIAQAIRNAPAVSCSAVPWSLFGISMAGYNVLLCGVLGLYALIASIMTTRRANGV